QLKFVGRDPDKSVLAYDSDPSVEVVGFVDDERSYLSAACALVEPLRLGGGSRLKILTAMSMSRPIVSTTVGAEGIRCQDKRDIFLADEPKEFADRIITLYRNERLQREIGEAARKTAETLYDWKSIGQRARNFLIAVVESRSTVAREA